MKFSIHRNQLRLLTDAVKGVAGSTLSHPIMEFIQLRVTEDGVVEAAGTNFNQSTISRGEASTVDEPGEIMMPRKICEFAKELPDADILITTNEKHKILMTAGNYKATMSGDSCELFPPISPIEGVSFTVEMGVFKEWLRRTNPVISKEKSRYELAGVRLDRSNGVIRASATDGRRVAACYYPLDGEAFAVTAPIDPLLDVVKSAPEGSVTITISEKKVQFAVGERYISIASLLTDNFPSIDRIIPSERPPLFWLPRAEALKILKRLSYSADMNINDVRLTLQDGVVTFLVQNDEAGMDGLDTLNIDCQESISFRVNIRFLIDALAACDGERVRFEIDPDNLSNTHFKNSSPKPIPISDDREKFVYVLMPLREAEED